MYYLHLRNIHFFHLNLQVEEAQETVQIGDPEMRIPALKDMIHCTGSIMTEVIFDK